MQFSDKYLMIVLGRADTLTEAESTFNFWWITGPKRGFSRPFKSPKSARGSHEGPVIYNPLIINENKGTWVGGGVTELKCWPGAVTSVPLFSSRGMRKRGERARGRGGEKTSYPELRIYEPKLGYVIYWQISKQLRSHRFVSPDLFRWTVRDKTKKKRMSCVSESLGYVIKARLPFFYLD